MTTDLSAAVAAILAGQVVGMPTDTVYGLAVDPLSEEAVARLYEIKGRPDHKPVGLLAADLAEAESVADIEGAARDLANRHWPGALTLIVRPTVILADWVGDRHRQTVGIRVPDHPLAVEFLAQTGPLAVTSANRSGGRETMTAQEAEAEFGAEVAFYIPGVSPGGEASTVVDMSTDRLRVLRQGPVAV